MKINAENLHSYKSKEVPFYASTNSNAAIECVWIGDAVLCSIIARKQKSKCTYTWVHSLQVAVYNRQQLDDKQSSYCFNNMTANVINFSNVPAELVYCSGNPTFIVQVSLLFTLIMRAVSPNILMHIKYVKIVPKQCCLN